MPDRPSPERAGAIDVSGSDEAQNPLAESPKIGMKGDFLDRVVHVADSSVSLVSGIGYVEDDEMVLVPFADVTLRQEVRQDGETPPIFSELLTLDNLAGLLADLCTDFHSACQELGQIAQGRIGLEPSQLSYLKQTLRHMSEQVQACIDEMDRIPGRDGSEAGDAGTE